ncbi:hypothetical protein PENSPDRAFT_106637 [Peniophora sp. CONT]|nr:hypothetical protein PENSPDRAFT_106637 [Peniophora sp. CONT]
MASLFLAEYNAPCPPVMFKRVRKRWRRSQPASSFEPNDAPSMDGPSSQQTPSTGDIGDLWKAALHEYHQLLHIDLRDKDAPFVRALEPCSTSDEVLEVIQNTSSFLNDRRLGKKQSRAIRRALKPLVHHLHIILNATAETASSLGVPGGKGIFAAVGILLNAAESVSAVYINIEKLLQRLRAYIKRLKVRVRVPLKSESKEIAVVALVKTLKTLASLTRIVQRGRMQQFLYALFSNTDEIGSASEGLEEVEVEEERMAIAELIVGVEHLSSSVRAVAVSTANFHQSMDGTLPTLARTDITTQAVLAGTRANQMQGEIMTEMLQTLLARTTALTPSNMSLPPTRMPRAFPASCAPYTLIRAGARNS